MILENEAERTAAGNVALQRFGFVGSVASKLCLCVSAFADFHGNLHFSVLSECDCWPMKTCIAGGGDVCFFSPLGSLSGEFFGA